MSNVITRPGFSCSPFFEPHHDDTADVNYQGVVTIESFDPNMERIAKLSCIWRKLADSPEQLATEGLRFLKGLLA
jgi:sugar phosphate isomerase/epimerase